MLGNNSQRRKCKCNREHQMGRSGYAEGHPYIPEDRKVCVFCIVIAETIQKKRNAPFVLFKELLTQNSIPYSLTER